VLENPEDRGFFHAHWLIFVPLERHDDFAAKVVGWLKSEAPKIYSPQPIHIKPVPALFGAAEYMLKGQFPSIARHYGITPEYQGWIPGKKRSGCSKNLGPTHHEETWRAGKHQRPEHWRVNKYPSRTRVM
jgi:hypothetical protein